MDMGTKVNQSTDRTVYGYSNHQVAIIINISVIRAVIFGLAIYIYTCLMRFNMKFLHIGG